MRTRSRNFVARACITQSLGTAALPLLEQALADGGFWEHLERVRRTRRPESVRVAIKPDLDLYDPAIPDGTEPQLVEHLIDLLHGRGYTAVTVLDGRNEPDRWLSNRDPLMVPDLAGYRFATPKGRPYEIVDARGETPSLRPW